MPQCATCRICKVSKPFTREHWHRNALRRKTPYACRLCANKTANEYYKAKRAAGHVPKPRNPDKPPELPVLATALAVRVRAPLVRVTCAMHGDATPRELVRLAHSEYVVRQFREAHYALAVLTFEIAAQRNSGEL